MYSQIMCNCAAQAFYKTLTAVHQSATSQCYVIVVYLLFCVWIWVGSRW